MRLYSFSIQHSSDLVISLYERQSVEDLKIVTLLLFFEPLVGAARDGFRSFGDSKGGIFFHGVEGDVG